ncbi:hypothetical protein ASD62_11725 [Phycicoccus sp. Root563]|uniref:glycosyltransferase n=1 Tax=Phycicoccus sp. Root563 TaxID=1736562 RepID=UPI000702E966|nr:glycosyltransferase [Phycicoccus sp. Root563]KQZ89868.1 hypothetical protein ASD62_11725 [Phycicoccus sp. Root563]
MNDRLPRVLLATHTFAFWGGLQDWAVGMARGLAGLGVEVGFITNNERMYELAAPFSAYAKVLDWSTWRDEVDEVLAAGPWDVVFAQPFGSRELGVALKKSHHIPLVAMCHGNNADSVYAWGGVADLVLLASSSLRPTMVDYGGVDDSRVEVLANGVPDNFFDHEAASYEARFGANGDVSFVIASRLAPDKLNQIPAMEHLVAVALRHPDIRTINVQVLGGGFMRSVFESRLGELALNPRVNVEMLGWVDVETVRERMRNALFTVVGGVSGTQSVSLGTACLGAGIRCVAGVSTPANVDTVLGTNFGDHSVRDTSPAQLTADINWMLNADNYGEFQSVYVPIMRSERSHTAVAARALQLLRTAMASIPQGVHHG